MITLNKYNRQKQGLRPYFTITLVFGIIMLLLTYFSAFVAQFEHNALFMSYENIFRLIIALNIVFFAMLSAVMSYRFITSSTSRHNFAIRAFSSGNCRKIFLLKVFSVFIFVLLAMLTCTLLPFIIFMATESFLPIVSDKLTGNTLSMIAKTTLLSTTAVSITGLITMEIGYISRSIPAALLSALLLSCVYGNILVNPAGNTSLPPMFTGLSLAAALVVLLILTVKINH